MPPEPPKKKASFDIKKRVSAIGAEISGLNLSEPLSEPDFVALEAALLDHLVLFFRDQPLDPIEQVSLAERFGKIEIHPFGRHLEAPPSVGILDQTSPKHDGANRWHADSTFMPRPPKAAILRAVTLPSSGGDTTWASMYAAYDALSGPLQRALEEMTAFHDVSGPLIRAIQRGQSVAGLEEIRDAWPPLAHPVVCRHPRTGRKFLYVNSNFTTHIDGIGEAESEALLRFLIESVRSPEIQVRFRWEPDSVALWDNRCTQHFAIADYSERRVMHRVLIAGDWEPSA
ncbi:MAG: taurine dioxygenase [bacterium]|nr:taurine dioxygenase [Deltaproteobacteria bacterium]MCP4904332.1 taurine dioxygenase [bacterium]